MRRLIAREFPFPGASTVDHVAVLASKLGPLTDTSHLGHAVPEMRSGRCVLRALARADAVKPIRLFKTAGLTVQGLL